MGVAMRLTFRLLVTLCWLIPLTSCTANYVKNTTVSSLEWLHLLDRHQVNRNQSFALHPASKIYIHSTSYSTKAHARELKAPALPRTQYLLEKSVLVTFRSAFPFAAQGESGMSLEESFNAALEVRAEYLVYPYIAIFDDKLNTVSEISEGRGLHEDASYGPDDSTINLVVFD